MPTVVADARHLDPSRNAHIQAVSLAVRLHGCPSKCCRDADTRGVTTDAIPGAHPGQPTGRLGPASAVRPLIRRGRDAVLRREPRAPDIDVAPRERQPRDGGSSVNIIAWIVLGAIAGYLAGFLVKGDEGLGVIGHIVLGIVGAVVGGFLAGVLFNTDPIDGALDISSIVVATIGAVITVLVVGAVTGRSRVGRGPV